MKKILLILFSFGMMGCMVFAPLALAVDLQWNANTETDLAGYNIHWGKVSRQYTQRQDNGNKTTATLALSQGTWFIAVTAYDLSGNESGFSNEVTASVKDTTPPADPTQLKIVITVGGLSGEPTSLSLSVNGKMITWTAEKTDPVTP